MARAMMKVQMEHALTRLSEAFVDILGDPPKQRPTLRDEQRCALVKSGAVKITPALVKRAISRQGRSSRANGRYCDSIEDCVREELKHEINKVYKTTPDPAAAKYEKRRAKLQLKFREAKDEIILGDVDRALKLIAAFAKTKV